MGRPQAAIERPAVPGVGEADVGDIVRLPVPSHRRRVQRLPGASRIPVRMNRAHLPWPQPPPITHPSDSLMNHTPVGRKTEANCSASPDVVDVDDEDPIAGLSGRPVDGDGEPPVGATKPRLVRCVVPRIAAPRLQLRDGAGVRVNTTTRVTSAPSISRATARESAAHDTGRPPRSPMSPSNTFSWPPGRRRTTRSRPRAKASCRPSGLTVIPSPSPIRSGEPSGRTIRYSDRYAATAPAGRYRIVLRNGHHEEGESSDYLLWRLQSEPVELDGDRAIDLTVPFGYARLWAVDDDGRVLDEGGSEIQASSEFAIADGISVSAETNVYGTGDDNFSIAVIGPSKTTDFYVDGADLKNGVYLAPDEDTVIAFIAGTGPGYDPLPTTTTTTTTSNQPTTTTTSGSGTATSNDPPVGPGSRQPAPTTASGYWALGSDGAVYNFGDAPALGHTVNGAVDLEPTPTGKGYYTVASDGGIFAFGDAKFLGSMGDTTLNAPVQSLVPDADEKGYWLVASDGGIFAFDAPFKGSLGGVKLNKPVVGMVRYGDGYLMVGADGGIFNFSSLPFSGSLGDKTPASPVVAVAALP